MRRGEDIESERGKEREKGKERNGKGGEREKEEEGVENQSKRREHSPSVTFESSFSYPKGRPGGWVGGPGVQFAF